MVWLLSALVFGNPQPPHYNPNDYPLVVKEALVWVAKKTNLHFPDQEWVDWDNFDGVFELFRRRAIGDPLPSPCDPILGVKP